MSKSTKVSAIRPAPEDSLDDIVSVTQSELSQSLSIIRLARAKLGDDQPDVDGALATVEYLLDRSWDRLNGCQGRDAD
jgi:hypothetical protein